MSLDRLADTFIRDALPLWASVGFDEDAGQFMEALSLDGGPDTTGIVRTRTAARVIYVFAHATVTGHAPANALGKAERAFHNLHATAWIDGDEPGYARAIDRRAGAVVDPIRDLYDHACVLLAQAWLLKATGDPAYRTGIERTLGVIDRTLAAPAGGWAEDHLGTTPRRQNPHMHLFEACLALSAITGDPRHVARAGELFGSFRTTFFDERIGTIREFFGPRWEIGADFGSDRLDPGHMAEWVWLIRRYAAWADAPADDLCPALLEAAERLGRRDGSPFLVLEVDTAGRSVNETRRLWSQVELIKAHLAQYRATGDRNHREAAEDFAGALLATYLADTPPGTWRDAFDADGNAIATTVPASSLYHLWTLIAEIVAGD
ncbi:AGE family epimerase/isomerase [Bauldia sp.]|uniref:AGE family epimerase/isomerase n=1 Tax=Bauldia sp. TaxID=2575872 RepID=UPI003BAAFCFD